MKYRVLSYGLFLCPLFLLAIAPAQTVTFSRDTLTDNSRSRPTVPSADFNNDGREDFIKNCGQTVNTPKFAVLLSSGDGIYAPQTCYQIPSGLPYDFAVGDFNNDGSLDIAVVNGTSTLYLFLNNGQGKFHQVSVVTSAAIDYAVASDVNHDGTIDLVCAGTDPKLYVYFGKGDGTFRTGPTSPIDTPGRFSVGDFDGDGKGDLLFQVGVDYATNYAQVAYGDGQGHFQATPKIVSDVAWGAYDVDRDGKSDLIGIPFDFSLHGNRYYKEIRLLHANANRTFTIQTIALSQCDSGGVTPAVADFNGDGINDLMVAEASDCNGDGPFTVNVMLGRSDGTYQPEQPVYSSDVPLPFFLRVMRANRDSKPDVELIGEVFSPQGSSTERDLLFTGTTPGNFPKCGPPNRALGFNLCSPTRTVSPSTSVRFSIGAGNQTPGRKIEIWVDGKKMAENLKGFSHYSFLDTTLTLAPGTHRVGIFTAGWDNLLQEYMWTGGPGFTFPLTVGSGKCLPQGEGVTVCSPLNDATLASPVRAWAVGQLSRTTIARMEVWVDGTKQFTATGSNTLDTKLALASGLHQFTYYLIGADGSKLSNTVKATVK